LQPLELQTSLLGQAPNLNVGPTGIVSLTWIAPGSGADTNTNIIRLAQRHYGHWLKPISITDTGRPLLVNWADVPEAISVRPGEIVAAWPERFTDQNGAPRPGYGLLFARSHDAGRTWDTPMYLHNHRDGPEYGFVSLVATPSEIVAYWLDGRNSKSHDGGQMQLRSATIGSEGPPTARHQIDPRVCDCCQTSAAHTPGGPVVVYRDRSEGEIRDIQIASAAESQPVHRDHWTFAGCPVNGPAVAADRQMLAVAWFTAAKDAPKVKVAFSRTTDLAFGNPIEVHTGQALGRVSVAWVDPQNVVTTWLEAREPGAAQAQIVARRVSSAGKLGPTYEVAQTENSRAAGFPKMVRDRDQLLWAWTNVQDPSHPRVQLAHAPVTAFTD